MRHNFVAALTICLSMTAVVDSEDFRNNAVREAAADMVYTNGKIYTANDKNPFAEL